MSITLQGKLRIKKINGANGPFCVGDLETEIGDFRVKDAVLDQFDEGVYEGLFCIQQIFPWSYSANGRMVIEIRAKLADLQIEGQRASVPTPDPVEPDPAKEAPAAPVAVPQPEPTAQAADEGTTDTAAESASPVATEDAGVAAAAADDPDVQLFGAEIQALVAGRSPVKLDPTIDRIQFRKQRYRLKEELDFIFCPQNQTWYPSEHPDAPRP